MHTYIQATKLCVQAKTGKQAGLSRKLLGTPRCSWLGIEEIIHLCDDLTANCACTIASENTNVAEHTRIFTVFVHTEIRINTN